MNDLTQITTPVLQDWWERYVCPACMSKDRDVVSCSDGWHAVPAVTFECAGSAFSPLSIPVTELQQRGLLGESSVSQYGLVWTQRDRRERRRVLQFV